MCFVFLPCRPARLRLPPMRTWLRTLQACSAAALYSTIALTGQACASPAATPNDSSPIPSQAVIAPAPSLVGTVVDAEGGVLPGVVVTVMPQAGGDARAVISGINGRYAFEDLAEGTYRIDSYLPGFDVMRRNLVVVRRGETAEVDVTLPPSPYCECIDIWARLGISRPRLSARI